MTAGDFKKYHQMLVGNDTNNVFLIQIVPILVPFECCAIYGGGHLGIEPKSRLSNGGIRVDPFQLRNLCYTFCPTYVAHCLDYLCPTLKHYSWIWHIYSLAPHLNKDVGPPRCLSASLWSRIALRPFSKWRSVTILKIFFIGLYKSVIYQI